jgi:hypothetical protein
MFAVTGKETVVSSFRSSRCKRSERSVGDASANKDVCRLSHRGTESVICQGLDAWEGTTVIMTMREVRRLILVFHVTLFSSHPSFICALVTSFTASEITSPAVTQCQKQQQQ